MDYNCIRLVVSYEAKMIRRNNVFRVFAFILLVFIGYWQIGMQSNITSERWAWVATSSSFPFVNAYLFNLLQSLIIIFIVAIFFLPDKRSETMDVFEVRPVSNVEYFAGRMVALFFTFIVLNLISVCIALFVHLFLSDSPFRFSRYLFYLVTLIIPTFFFTSGCVLLCVRVVRSHALVVLLSGSFFLGVYFLCASNSLLDCWGRQLPNIFSDVVGHPDFIPYLLHRLAYLLLGASFIFFAFSLGRRKPNRTRVLLHAFTWGGVILCFGIFVLGVYARGIWNDNQWRKRYKQTYLEYDSPAKARVLSHDIVYHPKGNIFSATSKLVLWNPTKEVLSRVILYLNPALNIGRITGGDRSLGFDRKNQVIVIDTVLYPGEKCVLEVVYSGGIDERVCYLDVPEREYEHPFSKIGMFKYGKRHAFVSFSFTLLHPECLWYPVTIPPVKVNADFGENMNFSNYKLHVNIPPGQVAISQGEALDHGEYVVFVNDHKLSGISLTLGSFQKKKMQLASMEIEVYHFKGNDFFLKNLDTLGKPIQQQLELSRMYFEGLHGKKYAFKKLVLVETPASFTSYARKWHQSSDYVQPGIVFLPERASKLPLYYRYPRGTGKKDDQAVREYVQYLVLGNFQSSAYNLSPLFTTYTGCITSRYFPGIHIAFSRMLTLYSGANIRSYTDYDFSCAEAVEYLSGNSLLEALSDKEKAASTMSLISQKSLQLQALLTTSISWRELKRFLIRFNARVRFDEVDFSTFQKEFEEEFKVKDLAETLFAWYSQKQLPVFLVRNVSLQEFADDGDKKYVVSLDVWNKGEVDGVLSVVTRDKSVNGEEDVLSKNYIIPARACRSLHVVYDVWPRDLMISTNLSQNQPKGFSCPFSGKVIPRISSLPPEMEICDTLSFSNPDEIVVDNRDEGFQVVDSTHRRVLLPALFGKKEEKFLDWTALVAGMNYGDVVRDAYCKGAGNGQSFAEWKANIPRDGYYEVYAYYQDITKYVSRYCYGSGLRGAKLHYTVFVGEEAVPVDVDVHEVSPGWISLGRFYFREGVAKVRLSDEGGKQIMNPFGQPDPSMRQLIVADAMKWVVGRAR